MKALVRGSTVSMRAISPDSVAATQSPAAGN
jgi:hypothetical protein